MVFTCVSWGSWLNYDFMLSKLVVVDISGASAQEHLRRLGFGLQDCFHMPQFWAPRSGFDGLPCILWHPVQGPHQEGSLQGQCCSWQDQSTEGEFQIVSYLFLIHMNGFSKVYRETAGNRLSNFFISMFPLLSNWIVTWKSLWTGWTPFLRLRDNSFSYLRQRGCNSGGRKLNIFQILTSPFVHRHKTNFRRK